MNAMDAEIVVSALIEKLQKVLTVFPQYHEFEKQVQEAIGKLNLLKRRIKVAEDQLEASTDHSINDDRKLVQLLQGLYSAEDTIDILVTREGLQIIKTKVNSSKKELMFRQCHDEMKKFKEYPSSYDRLVYLTSHIKDVCYNDDTRSSSQNYHKGQQQRWERISDFFYKKETDIAVGFLEEINKLLNLVLTPADQAQSSRVIAVVGERGSGKTTIVRTVYEKILGKRASLKQAWVNVTSLYNGRYLLLDILKQILQIPSLEDETMISEEELIAELNKNLEGKRYHVVLEDVDSDQVWKSIHRRLCSLPTSGRSITITTSNEDIASSAAANNSILNVGKLTEVESWELFLKDVQKAKGISNKSDELITFKELILEVCGNLPLRIVMLGGLLSTKEMSKWSGVIEYAKAKDILALGYQELPTQVKPCFLYMGLFPGRFEIAEGFVTAPSEPATETVPEDIAEMYFEELVIRNMIQVRWRLDGTPKACCMPGLLYDIFSSKAADARFFYHKPWSSHDSFDKQPQFAVRRLAKRVGIKNKFHLENLRSYVAFDTRIQCSPATEIGTFLNKIITKRGLGLLRVLDLEGVYKPMLSDDTIGKLLLLSYLGLRSTGIDSLPSSVGDLPCLETLDVKHTIIYDLPTSIWRAKKLRHLYLNWGCSSKFISSSLPSQPPTNLQTLWGLSIDDIVGVGFLKSLTGLRKLGLTCTSSTAEATAKWVSQLTKLQSLKLRSREKGARDILYLKLPTMKTHHNLQDLYLLEQPSPKSLTKVEFPPNLKTLTLSSSKLVSDPMPVLGLLPHLHILRLSNIIWKYTKMKCSRGAFPKLRVLKLWRLLLAEWIVEEGAMPYLRELEVRDCRYLKITGWQHLITLKKVALINAPRLDVSTLSGSPLNNINLL